MINIKVGFVNIGETNNKLQEFENAMSDQSELPLASSMLVFEVRAFFQA